MRSRIVIGIVGAALAAMVGCGSSGGEGGGGSGGTGATGTGGGGVAEPKLAATCDDQKPCPTGLTCELDLGCVIESCPTAGQGDDHGCPANGFCYMFDGMTSGYCARVCETDADCTAVNSALSCLQRSATEAFGLKICVMQGG